MKPVTMSCMLTDLEFRHKAHDLKIGNTTVFHCNGWPLTKPKPKISVRWEMAPTGYAPRPMWVGRCAGCNKTTQYWSWGAALGHMLEHQWIGCEGDERRGADRRAKYAASKAQLSCGGRTHGIMGEDQRPVARRTDMPADVSTVSREPSLQGDSGQAPKRRWWR